MYNNRALAAGSIAITLLLGGNAHASTNLVTNGGFETGDISGWTEVGNFGATAQCSGSVCNRVAFTNNNGMVPYAGNDFFMFGNLTASGSAGLSQTLTTSPGGNYILSFAWSTSGLDTLSDQSYQVLWDGNVVDSFSPTNGPTPWALVSLSVTGTGSDTLVIEGFRNNGYNGIDNVSVTAAPEPVTWVLMMVGVGGMGAALRNRRRKVAA